MLQTVIEVTESKTSPRHLNFLKQLKKTTEMMPLLRVLFLDTPGPRFIKLKRYEILLILVTFACRLRDYK